MDPYAPPAAPLREPSRPPPQGFRVWPVIAGGLGVDYVGSNLLGVLLGIGVGIWLAASHGAQGVTADRAREIANAPPLVAIEMVLGLGMTTLGGYVAARWARHRFLLHAGAAGSISLGLAGIQLLLSSGELNMPWRTAFGFLVQVPLALCGGWLAARRATREAAAR